MQDLMKLAFAGGILLALGACADRYGEPIVTPAQERTIPSPYPAADTATSTDPNVPEEPGRIQQR